MITSNTKWSSADESLLSTPVFRVMDAHLLVKLQLCSLLLLFVEF